MKARKLISVLKVLLLAALGVVVAFPFFWMISCALREPGELLTMKLLPDNPTIDNFRRVLFETDIPRYFLNSYHQNSPLRQISKAFALYRCP